MKKLLLALMLLIPFAGKGQQVQMIQTKSSQYYVVYRGDTLSNHYTEHKALERASNDLMIAPGDTIHVLLYKDIRVFYQDPSHIKNINWSSSSGASQWRLNVSYDSDADTTWVEAKCIKDGQRYSVNKGFEPGHISTYFDLDNQCYEYNQFVVKAVNAGSLEQNNVAVSH